MKRSLIPNLIKNDPSLIVFAGVIPATQEHEPLQGRGGDGLSSSAMD
jgi:hypothetical protein